MAKDMRDFAEALDKAHEVWSTMGFDDKNVTWELAGQLRSLRSMLEATIEAGSGFLGNENPGPCAEPGGNLVTDTGSGVDRAHDVMIELTGQCPWCGEEESP